MRLWSPGDVVEYKSGYDAAGDPFRRDDTRRGRMWFATMYLRDGVIVAADADFVRWASRILQWVRRHWSRYDSFRYESPNAADAANDP